MSEFSRYELVSFDLCPYVQRSVITLKHKKVPFKLTFIDLQDPPEWFEELSPLGKVPLLLVRESAEGAPTVLFESAVINEYIDEVTAPSLQLRDPLRKAFERAWIQVGSEILMNFYSMTMVGLMEEAEEPLKENWEILSRLEAVLPGGRFFRGQEFSLVDAAMAPAFMRMLMFRSLREAGEWKALPKTRKWAESLVELPEVRDSVIPEFREKTLRYLKENESPWADEI